MGDLTYTQSPTTTSQPSFYSDPSQSQGGIQSQEPAAPSVNTTPAPTYQPAPAPQAGMTQTQQPTYQPAPTTPAMGMSQMPSSGLSYTPTPTQPTQQRPPLWFPQQQQPQQAPRWQPAQAGYGPMPMMPRPGQGQSMYGAQVAAPFQSIMRQALAGGNNAQQTQNFLQALKMSGAGNNNVFMASPAPTQQQPQQLLGGMAQNNGSAGSANYTGGFNGGMGNVSYNYGLGSGYAPSFQNYQQQPTQQAGSMGSFYQPPPAQPQGTMGTFYTSDEREKKSIDGGEYKVQGFLDAIKAHSYEYKDPANGVGRFVSPMAQELEKTELGKSAVIETPDGKKMVDYGRLGGINLAAAAMLNERVNALEKSFKLRKRA